MKNILHKLEEHSTLVAILIGVFGCFFTFYFGDDWIASCMPQGENWATIEEFEESPSQFIEEFIGSPATTATAEILLPPDTVAPRSTVREKV